MGPVDPLAPFLTALRPLLRTQGAKAAYLVGSWARGEADGWSDVDVVIVAPSVRPAVERFKDYLPAILASPRPVELFVYTPEEFERMRAEERPFLLHALEGAKLVYEGRRSGRSAGFRADGKATQWGKPVSWDPVERK